MDQFSDTIQAHLDWVKSTCDALTVQDKHAEILSNAMIDIYIKTNYAGGESKAAQINAIAKTALLDTGYIDNE